MKGTHMSGRDLIYRDLSCWPTPLHYHPAPCLWPFLFNTVALSASTPAHCLSRHLPQPPIYTSAPLPVSFPMHIICMCDPTKWICPHIKDLYSIFFYLKSKRDTQLIAWDWFRCASAPTPHPHPPRTASPPCRRCRKSTIMHFYLCQAASYLKKLWNFRAWHDCTPCNKTPGPSCFACKLMQICQVSSVYRHVGKGPGRNVIWEEKTELSECFSSALLRGENVSRAAALSEKVPRCCQGSEENGQTGLRPPESSSDSNNCHRPPWMNNTSALQADGLRQQRTTLGGPPVSREQETGATILTCSPNCSTEDYKGCLVSLVGRMFLGVNPA